MYMPSANPTLARSARAALGTSDVPVSPVPAGRFQRAPIHVVLAADDARIRCGLREMLYAADRGSFEVVAEASDDQGARRFAHAHKPCVVVLSLNMQDHSSLDAIPLIRSESPEAHIVVLATQHEIAGICQALRAGATGYVIQEYAPEALAHAVRCAAAGHGYLTTALGAPADTASATRSGCRRGNGPRRPPAPPSECRTRRTQPPVSSSLILR